MPDQSTAFVNYGAYLASREWALLKVAVRERSGGICERCHNAPATQCHHRTYERLYHEEITDLEDLCAACHEYESGKRRVPPMPRLDERGWAEFQRDPMRYITGK